MVYVDRDITQHSMKIDVSYLFAVWVFPKEESRWVENISPHVSHLTTLKQQKIAGVSSGNLTISSSLRMGISIFGAIQELRNGQRGRGRQFFTYRYVYFEGEGGIL